MGTKMTLREKCAHLYRRFGLGATPAELDVAEKLGLDGTLRRLIDFEGVDPNDFGDPHEFMWREKEEADPGTYRTRVWWYLQMLTTPRPLQEKLAIFWHGHFAASDNKVEDGPMMLDYFQTIRQHAAGKFPDLLKAVGKSPAMLKYLDMDRAMRGRPNENFAREVMELFTMGIGNYTETDVKEVARALTGWGYLNLYYEMPGNNTQKITDALNDGRSLSSFVELPGVRDNRPKTVLGKTADFTGDDVLDLLAKQPATAKFICGKLWNYFAYEDPEPKVVSHLAETFHRSGGDIKKTLHAMAQMPEFWSSKCVRQHPKNPVEFVVGISRAQGIGSALASMRDPKADKFTRIPQRIFDEMWGIIYRVDRQGLSICYPPNVAGWKWGSHWITPTALAERYQFPGTMYWGNKGPEPGSLQPLEFVKSRKPKDTAGIVDAICELFDVPLPAESRKLVGSIFDQSGGIKALEDKNVWTDRLYRSMKLICAAPEMQVG